VRPCRVHRVPRSRRVQVTFVGCHTHPDSTSGSRRAGRQGGIGPDAPRSGTRRAPSAGRHETAVREFPPMAPGALRSRWWRVSGLMQRARRDGADVVPSRDGAIVSRAARPTAPPRISARSGTTRRRRRHQRSPITTCDGWTMLSGWRSDAEVAGGAGEPRQHQRVPHRRLPARSSSGIPSRSASAAARRQWAGRGGARRHMRTIADSERTCAGSRGCRSRRAGRRARRWCGDSRRADVAVVGQGRRSRGRRRCRRRREVDEWVRRRARRRALQYSPSAAVLARLAWWSAGRCVPRRDRDRHVAQAERHGDSAGARRRRPFPQPVPMPSTGAVAWRAARSRRRRGATSRPGRAAKAPRQSGAGGAEIASTAAAVFVDRGADDERAAARSWSTPGSAAAGLALAGHETSPWSRKAANVSERSPCEPVLATSWCASSPALTQQAEDGVSA